MALAAVAVPALFVAAFLGWSLITTVSQVEREVETALVSERQIGDLRALLQKEHGDIARVPSEFDPTKLDVLVATLNSTAGQIDDAISAVSANERIVPKATADQIRFARDEMMRATKEIVEATKGFQQATAQELVYGPFEANFGSVVALLDGIRMNVDHISRTAREDLKTSSAWAWVIAPVGVLLILAAVGAGLWFVRQSVIRPVSAIVKSMAELVQGNHEFALPGVNRKDEIGEMSRAVGVFRDAAIEKIRLEGQTEEQRRSAEEERSRSTAVQARAAEEQASAIRALAEGLHRLSQGDLTFRLTDEFTEEYAQIKEDFNSTVAALQETIGAIAAATREVTNTSAEISSSTTDLSQRTEEQAASLEETSASMEEISATVKKNAENAQQANQFAISTREVADQGGQIVGEAVSSMARIEESSNKISDIIGVIDEIAFQTNLLALNAAVEAARAGEAGRGFAVVAAEVRSLAQRSSQAAKDIKDLINKSSSQVQEGVELVNKAGAALNEIVGSIKKVADIVSGIATASSEQATGIDQINTALSQMDEVTQQNSALVEENAASAKSLEQQASAMDERVRQFQVGDVNVETARVQAPALQPEKPAKEQAPAPAKAKAPVAPKQKANGRGPVGRMQAAVAHAFQEDSEWKEF
jgi:methyl-accepting chemotaxis protein